jgi:hypothetical protein
MDRMDINVRKIEMNNDRWRHLHGNERKYFIQSKRVLLKFIACKAAIESTGSAMT